MASTEDEEHRALQQLINEMMKSGKRSRKRAKKVPGGFPPDAVFGARKSPGTSC